MQNEPYNDHGREEEIERKRNSKVCKTEIDLGGGAHNPIFR